MKALGQTIHFLDSLKLKGITLKLVDYRIKRRMERNLTGAHLPVIKKMEDFDFGKVQGIGKSQASNLLDCRWIDNRENLLFFGPRVLGKPI